jgi:hypothetical protein
MGRTDTYTGYGIVQGRDFLEVASFLRDEQGEPFLRTRIGRAYYAAYLEARSFCELHLSYVRSPASREHQDVARLIRHIDATIADDLRFLRGFRNAADYDIHLSTATILLSSSDAVQLAIQIISSLDLHVARMMKR